MKRFLPLALSAVLALSAFAIDLSAPSASAEASCSQAQLNIWEHSGFNGSGLAICYGTNISDLGNYGFDNKMSSGKFIESPTKSLNTTVCVYEHQGYVGLLKKFTTDQETVQWYNFFNAQNDKASSIKFGC